jgi:hypothetical protein
VAVAGIGEQLAREVEHIGLQVRLGPRHQPRLDLAAERRGLLDRERVRGHVLGAERDGLLKRLAPRRERLPVRPVDQVQVHVRVARGPGGGERAPHGRGPVQSLQRIEDALVERLCAHRKPRVPGLAQRGQLRRIDRVRVGLDRDLGPRLDVEPPPKAPQQAPQVGLVERGRGPAAEEDRSEPLPSPVVGPQPGLGLQRLAVSRRQVAEPGVRVEVAVAATREAERDVHVQAGGHGFCPAF